ncbi:unnamed protein product, partial [Ectocarpus sp. 13 AM-2016]
ATVVGTLSRQGGEEERQERNERKPGRSRETITPMHRKEDEKPSEEFWEHFFREENFQGKTLGDFLNDASPTPTAVKKREAWFDVPHRELFYKEEDLRCFRTNGTYIGDDCDPDDLEEEAAGTEQEPYQESEPPAVSVFFSADDATRVPRRKEAEHTECQEKGEWEEEGEGRLPGTGSTGYRPAQTPEELCLGAAAFAAASAAYGRPSSSGSGSKEDHRTGSSRNVNKSGGHGGPKQQQKQRHERVGGKRQRSAASGDGGSTGASVGDSSGDDPRKRRRAAGGVLAPTSSSLGRAAATKSVLGEIGVANSKDPMHKKLLEFRQKKSSTSAAVAGAGKSKAPTKGKRAVSKTTSVQTVAAIQAKPARGRPASTRGRTNVASVRGSRSASLKGSVTSAAGAPARGMAGTANSTPHGVSLGVSSASIAGGPEAEAKKSVSSSTNVRKNVPKTVSKPVTTVKRNVSGNGGGVGGPKSAREQSTGVKRKGPAVLSSNVTDRTKR